MADDTTGCQKPACPDLAEAAEGREDLARVFRALGHPARLAIIETLANRTTACCGEIVDCLPLAQSTVSQHLQVLKDTGLLICAVKGRNCSYCLNTAALAKAAAASGGFFEQITGALAAAGNQCGCGDAGLEDRAGHANSKESDGVE